MHFPGAGSSHHPYDLARGSASDDGVVDEDDALAFEQAAHRVQLHAHAEVAHALLRLNEGAAHVVIADEAEVERNARFSGIAKRGGHAGVRHRNDEVGGNAGLTRKLAAVDPPIQLGRVSGTGDKGVLISVFMLQAGEEQIVAERLRAILTGGKS